MKYRADSEFVKYREGLINEFIEENKVNTFMEIRKDIESINENAKKLA